MTNIRIPRFASASAFALALARNSASAASSMIRRTMRKTS
jgi:hypothetical protein